VRELTLRVKVQFKDLIGPRQHTHTNPDKSTFDILLRPVSSFDPSLGLLHSPTESKASGSAFATLECKRAGAKVLFGMLAAFLSF
jgi:hypothetical protein